MGVGVWRERLRQNAEMGKRLRVLAGGLTPAELAVDVLAFRDQLMAAGDDLPEALRCATAIVAYRGEIAARMRRGES